jgi:hypothetical protein
MEKASWGEKQEFEDLKEKYIIYAFLGGFLIWTIICPIIF